MSSRIQEFDAGADQILLMAAEGIQITATRFSALAHRNFRLFFGGQLISLSGTWMQSTAQLWLAYRLTHSATFLGIIGFANLISVLLLAPVGGYLGDRRDRHRVLISTQVAAMLLSLSLAVLTIAGLITRWELVLIGLLSGMVYAFEMPIRQSFFVHMVGPEDLASAIALNSVALNGARIVGPAVAGFVISAIGEGGCFLLNAVSFLAIIACLLAMRIEHVRNPAQEQFSSTGFTSAIQYILKDTPSRSALLLMSLLSLLAQQYVVFLPIFASDVLHRGARGMGTLMGVAGLGALLGATAFAARLPRYTNMEKWIAIASLTTSSGIVLFCLSGNFFSASVLLFFVGLGATLGAAATNILLQSRVPGELRSRLMAIYAVAFIGLQPIGALLGGMTARHIGAPLTLCIFGLVCLIGSAGYFLTVLRGRQLSDG